MGEKKADPKVVRLKFVRRVWRNKTDLVAFGNRLGKVLKVDVRRRHFLVALMVDGDIHAKLPAGVEVVKPGTPDHPPTMGIAPKRHRQRIDARNAARGPAPKVKKGPASGKDDGKKASGEGHKP